MRLTILGHGAGGPYHGRPYTAQALQVENQLFLIDCGEGTQMQLFHYRVRYDRCNHIFISHLHGDHVFGLMGIITNWCLKKRTAPLHVYSPPGLAELVETTCRVCQVYVPYPIEFHEVDTTISARVWENQQLEIYTIPLHHRIATTGWLFREKAKPRHMRADKITEYDIHYSLIPGIKAGHDLTLPDGRVIPNAELTTAPSPSRTYAFCSDTAPSPFVAEVVRDADVLYHEATFADEHTEEAAISLHSTATQAALIAKQANVGQLLLGHFSARYPDATQLLLEARSVFLNTETVEPGSVWEIGVQEVAIVVNIVEEISIEEKNVVAMKADKALVRFSK